jgi:abortive infection bacteriophage resistance protein
MRYKKTFKTYSEQLEILIQRGLIVEDKELAKSYLKKLNYYRFSSYCIPFQKEKDKFYDNIFFSDILRLYDFDSSLRALLFVILEKVEVQLRTLMAYFFGKVHGPWGYTDASSFNYNFSHDDWFTNINREIERSNEVFIKHFKDKYRESPYLPVWMVVEIMSLGSISCMFQGMKYADQKELSKEFGVKRKVVISWLHHLNYIRNTCAHHNRLWNRLFRIKPKVPDDHFGEFLKENNDKLFATFSILLYLVNQFGLDINIIEKLEIIFNKYEDSFQFSLKKEMGFPKYYDQISLWNS